MIHKESHISIYMVIIYNVKYETIVKLWFFIHTGGISIKTQTFQSHKWHFCQKHRKTLQSILDVNLLWMCVCIYIFDYISQLIQIEFQISIHMIIIYIKLNTNFIKLLFFQLHKWHFCQKQTFQSHKIHFFQKRRHFSLVRTLQSICDFNLWCTHHCWTYMNT